MVQGQLHNALGREASQGIGETEAVLGSARRENTNRPFKANGWYLQSVNCRFAKLVYSIILAIKVT